MEHFTFIGKRSVEEEQALSSRLVGNREKSREGIIGEIPKTELQEKVFLLAAKLLRQELSSVGIVPKYDLGVEHFHIVNEELGASRDAGGTYDPEKLLIKIDGNSLDSLQLLMTALHEGVHSFALQKYKKDDIGDEDDWGPGGAPLELSVYRSGYFVSKDSSGQKLRYFDEGIVEMMTIEIIEKHKNAIEQSFYVTSEEWERFSNPLEHAYCATRFVIGDIIKNVAKFTQQSEQEVWLKMKRGEFSGEMMHLRDIRKTYGQWALQMLSALDLLETEEQEYRDEIEEYFSGDASPERRAEIAELVLGLH